MSKVLLSEVKCSDFKSSKQLHKYVYEKTSKKEVKEIEVLKYVDIDEKPLTDEMLVLVRNHLRDELKKDDKEDLRVVLQKLLEKDVTVSDLKTVIKNNTDQFDVTELQKSVYDRFNVSLTSRQIKSLLIV